jgi:16S rRNA (guanine966-N2)-methyltransferase
MRVISGKYGSRILLTLSGNDITRPTLDKVKGAVFSSIGPDFDEEDSFLDIFSGCGAMGIEALSRGCNNVVMNDANKRAYLTIKDNLDNFGIKDVELYNLDYKLLLNQLIGREFNYIYIDPPYSMKIIDEILLFIDQNELLAENGTIIIESDIKDSFSKNYKNIKFKRDKAYRLTRITYYKGEK